MSEHVQGSDPQKDPDTVATVAQPLCETQGDTGLADRAVGQLGQVAGKEVPTTVRLQAQALAHRSWGKCTDRTARTQAGRSKFEQRFMDLAGGDPVRAASLRKAYYADLARQGVEARRRNRQARENGAA